jgi:heat shock protein HslJ
MTSDDTVIVLVDEEVAVPDRDLVGTGWQLDSVTTAGAVNSVPAGVRSMIEFDDEGAVVAFLGCNWARGSYDVRGDVLRFGPLATTKKACPPPASDVESELSTFLNGSVVYSIDGDTLILTARKVVGPGPTALIYRAAES